MNIRQLTIAAALATATLASTAAFADDYSTQSRADVRAQAHQGMVDQATTPRNDYPVIARDSDRMSRQEVRDQISYRQQQPRNNRLYQGA